MKRSREERDMFDEVLGSDSEQECATAPEASTSAAQFEPEEEEAAAAEMVQGEQAKHEKVLDLAKLAKFNKKVDNTGVVYISRIPPGMGPSKLKHLLSKYGETNRVYLARDPKDTRKTKKKGKERHQAHRFVEGWIEFIDKGVGRRTAEMLNAERIGGKKSDPFCDDIWTLKYLPKFKWSDLSASVAHQRAMDAALLRNEISQSKKAQTSYLDQVDKARVLEKRREKAEASGKAPSAAATAAEAPAKTERSFKQRKLVKEDGSDSAQKRDRGTPGQKKELQNVMDNLFG